MNVQIRITLELGDFDNKTKEFKPGSIQKNGQTEMIGFKTIEDMKLWLTEQVTNMSVEHMVHNLGETR